MALFLVPIARLTALVSFEGDLVFVMFLFTLIAVTVFIAGWSSVNRFSTVGGVRAAFQMLGYEVPMTLVMVGAAITARTLSISRIDRCLFCGQCEEVCPENAITMTDEYELASYDRAGMIIEFKREEKVC